MPILSWVCLLVLLVSVGDCASQQQSSQVSLVQEIGIHWLVGQWEGNIDQYTGEDGPRRILRVVAVSADGTADATWAANQALSGANIQVDGLRVKVVTGANGVVELTRRNDGTLVGIFTPQRGQSLSIRLSKIIAANELTKFEPTPDSRQHAIAAGQGREYLTAMEAFATEAEIKQRWGEASMTYAQASDAASSPW
jgi:hypothetical protein